MGTNTETLTSGSDTVTRIQGLMKKQDLKALLIRSTDCYFNEYVPISLRSKITGFTGSVGDAIITPQKAYLIVDGRYALQAKAQAPGFIIHVVKNAQSIESCWLNLLSEILSPGDVVAYDPTTIDLNLLDRLSATTIELKAQITPSALALLNEFLPQSNMPPQLAFKIDDHISGQQCTEKLQKIAPLMAASGLDAFLAVKLDDIAWLTNWRCHALPFQSTFPAIACILPDRLILGLSPSITFDGDKEQNIVIVHENELFSWLAKHRSSSSFRLGIDPAETSKAHELDLRKLNIEIKRVLNPISSLKAIKNDKELLHLRSAFKKADLAVHQTQNFVIDSFEKRKPITESDVDLQIRSEFKKSGAKELSFRPICASGKNGAIIHYGSPDHKEVIVQGSLFLLDTGAYYEGRYATDLTRTFLAARRSHDAQLWQKEMFTLVLKASIAGLSARVKRGTVGMQLDAIVRAPLWQRGLDFAHGTGHGIGINVHEFPPRISPLSNFPLLPGHVFSIEPGLYFEDRGGVRIENLATMVEDKDSPDFLRVLPLTFCPLDERLIDCAMLNDYEKIFLDYYRNEWKSDSDWPNLPPVPTSSLIAKL
jgi:Xaa-Pro aminopeptidase